MTNPFNFTHLEHIFVAIVLQAVFTPLIGLGPAGLVAVSGLYGREVCQHEFKEHRHTGKAINDLPIGFGMFNHWTLDSVLDVLLPALACGAIYYFGRGYGF